MVDVFIDEGGQFTPQDGWGVVCALVLPSHEVGRVRRKLNFQSRDWPKAPSGELKGGSLQANHLIELVDLLFPRNALLHAVAIDMSNEKIDLLNAHKSKQAEKLTEHLTTDHHDNLIKQIWELRRTLESMPTQLYVQSVLMTELTATVVEDTVLYFSQRHPQDLSSFRWSIDAKGNCSPPAFGFSFRGWRR